MRKVVSFSIALGLVAATLVPRTAHAYRPFDGTDAEVADVGEFELELGPIHYLGTPRKHYLIMPATVLNLGLFHNWELVIDGKNFVGLDGAPAEAGVRLLDTDVFLKVVLREGILQEKTGVSIAAEFGPLLPNVRGDDGFGAEANVIVSQRWKRATIHFNNAVALTRSQTIAAFSSVILEGPYEFPIRPVTEVFVEREFGEKTTVSALVGAIWRVHHEFSLDMGLRIARADEQGIGEVRLGFTWAIPLWGAK